MKEHFILACITTCLLCSCSDSLKEKGSPEYISEIKTWHNERIENLKKEDGWLNLVGLYWLKEGSNSFGSDPSNKIVFPKKAPSFIGDMILKDGIVTLNVLPNITTTSEGRLVQKLILRDDTTDRPTMIALGTLRWNVIKRQDKIGIRLRDIFSPLVKEFKGIETFPINEDWKIAAEFIPYTDLKEIPIQNVLGQITPTKVVGAIVFKKDGKEYRLEAFDGGKNVYFVSFRDETSEKETYGAGRFLSVSRKTPMFIDFNRAYNPPCAFTKFATCPIPPRENNLKLRVTAGERTFGSGYH